MVLVALWGRLRGVQEPLVAHVAFTAAEEDVGTLLPLHTLITAEDMEVGIRNKKHKSLLSLRTAEDMEAIEFLCATESVHTNIICMRSHTRTCCGRHDVF